MCVSERSYWRLFRRLPAYLSSLVKASSNTPPFPRGHVFASPLPTYAAHLPAASVADLSSVLFLAPGSQCARAAPRCAAIGPSQSFSTHRRRAKTSCHQDHARAHAIDGRLHKIQTMKNAQICEKEREDEDERIYKYVQACMIQAPINTHQGC